MAEDRPPRPSTECSGLHPRDGQAGSYPDERKTHPVLLNVPEGPNPRDADYTSKWTCRVIFGGTYGTDGLSSKQLGIMHPKGKELDAHATKRVF